VSPTRTGVSLRLEGEDALLRDCRQKEGDGGGENDPPRHLFGFGSEVSGVKRDPWTIWEGWTKMKKTDIDNDS